MSEGVTDSVAGAIRTSERRGRLYSTPSMLAAKIFLNSRQGTRPPFAAVAPSGLMLLSWRSFPRQRAVMVFSDNGETADIDVRTYATGWLERTELADIPLDKIWPELYAVKADLILRYRM